MKEKKCIICQSTRFKKIFDAKRPDFKQPLEIVQCQNCGLIFQLADLNQKTVAEYYNFDYYNHQSNWLEKILIDFLDNIRIKEINKYGLKGEVLDVGCGDGKLLLKLKQQGWKVIGLDTSLAAYKEVKELLGNSVFNKDLKECNFPSNFFDVVILWHTLEHIFSPTELLAEIYRILKPGGVLVVEVPNVDSPVYRLTRQDYFSFDDSTHLYHFSPKTLYQLLEINHFKVKTRGFIMLSFSLSLLSGLNRKLKRKLPSWLAKVIFLIASPFLFLLTLITRLISFYPLKGEALRVYCVKKLKL